MTSPQSTPSPTSIPGPAPASSPNPSRAARPRVLVTIGRDVPDRPTALRLDVGHVDGLVAAGAVPVLLPPGSDRRAVADVLAGVDGVLLPGGIDPHPRHFGEDVHPLTVVDERLDALEFLVIEEALEQRLPLLGICRGMQVLNVALGGSLVQHLPPEGPVTHRSEGPLDTVVHDIEIAEGTRLHGITGARRLGVNSWHHQAVARVAPTLRVSAVAGDGVVEAVESTQAAPWILGVQYHPEELLHHPAHRAVLAAFVRTCQEPPTPPTPPALGSSGAVR